MDGQTLTKLAKAHATLITQYTGLTQVEAISLASQIIQFIAGGTLGVGEVAAPSSNQPQTTPQARPTGSEDATGEGAVLARPGYISHCSACKSDVYEVITEIRGRGMGVNAFCQAFRPIGHDAVLTRDILEVVKDNNGNTFMDCPLCNGVKSLMLLGDKKTVSTKIGVAPVGSIGQGEL